MLVVNEIFQEIQRVLGTCSEEETYAKINEAMEELSNMGLWDPLVGFMDVCTCGDELTLPDDVEVPLKVNIGGVPADYRNKWFEFHLNGPGTECCGGSCDVTWEDRGNFPTFRDPGTPSAVGAYTERDEAQGLAVRIFGYNECDKWIMTPDCNGIMRDGFDAPIISGLGSGMTLPFKVKRITRIYKPVTSGFIRVVAFDSTDCSSGTTLLGLIRPNVTQPEFRRMKLSGTCCQTLCDGACATTWVRMRYRRRAYKVSQPTDAIMLHSVTALKQMCMSIRKYEADLLDEAEKYRLTAKASLEREQKSRSGPNQIRLTMDRHTYGGHPGMNMV